MTMLFTLLILFQLKHFICDYPLQNRYMLGKMQPKDWFFPLLSHAAVHAAATFLIVMVFTQALMAAIFIGLLDLLTHFLIDRLKASPSYGGRFKVEQPQFWWCLGADQMAHHLCHYFFIYLIILITEF